ncbi:hypothetical protein [Streptomyces virginiae]|uniref:Uncharacterized protein n=1 Tax=Streptomyces virginiae TaxID=1961 RepID=A0ABZ1TRY9_STRVG|nr:hypothetical protein [Streptomyces virginiae]
MSSRDDSAEGTPRGLCAWCGKPFPAVRVGRPREFCRQTCRQRAWEKKRETDRIKAAVEAALAEAGPPRVSSQTEPGVSSQTKPTSVTDETPAPPLTSAFPPPRAEVNEHQGDGLMSLEDAEAELDRRLARWLGPDVDQP